MNQEEQSMKMEYLAVALANLVLGALLFFAPVSEDAQAWSKWTLAAVSAICGWLLGQRGTEEKRLWPLKFVCRLTLIFGLFPLLYVPSGESLLEVFDAFFSKAGNKPEDVWNLQRSFALYGMLAFCVYLVWFAFHAQKKGARRGLRCCAVYSASFFCICSFFACRSFTLPAAPHVCWWPLASSCCSG
jgi:hypothetical protein